MSGRGVPIIQRGYQIIPSENSPFSEGDMILPHDPVNKCVLVCQSFNMTLEEWLANNKAIHDEVFHVETGFGKLEQIARPTKGGLSIVKQLLKAVGIVHYDGSPLFHPAFASSIRSGGSCHGKDATQVTTFEERVDTSKLLEACSRVGPLTGRCQPAAMEPALRYYC